MMADGTLLLRRSEVEKMLSINACIDAVENVFRLLGQGKVPAPGILAVKTALSEAFTSRCVDRDEAVSMAERALGIGK